MDISRRLANFGYVGRFVLCSTLGKKRPREIKMALNKSRFDQTLCHVRNVQLQWLESVKIAVDLGRFGSNDVISRNG